jgi:hypothetical protein
MLIGLEKGGDGGESGGGGVSEGGREWSQITKRGKK